MTEIIAYTKSKELIEAFPEFTELTIYGTVEEPLFPSSQVKSLLGITFIRFDDLEFGDEYVLMKTKTGGQHREQNLFTEQGLYSIIARSRTDLGRKFRKFVKVVFRELRLRGQVTLTDALAKLQREVAERDQKINVLDAECEKQHDELELKDREFEELRSKYYNEHHNATRSAKNATRLARENLELKTQTKTTSRDSQVLAKIKDRCMVQLHFVHEDDIDPADDDDTMWKLSKHPGINSFPVHVFKDTTMKQIHTAFATREMTIQNKYIGSIENIRGVIDDLILGEDRKSWPSVFD